MTTDTSLVIRSKIRDIAGEFSVAKDFPEALDAKVKELIEKAMSRAKENSRTTIMVRDL